MFQTKTPQEVSWTEAYPETSIEFIQSFNLDKSASIIDIGGGDSLLVDALLQLGFTDLSVLDISEKGLFATIIESTSKKQNLPLESPRMA